MDAFLSILQTKKKKEKNFQVPTPQNGQTRSNNFSIVFDPTKCLSMFDHFVGLVLKGLRTPFYGTPP